MTLFYLFILSCLYYSLEGGFPTAQEVFGAENVAQVPVDVSAAPYSGSTSSIVAAFSEFQAHSAALDRLARPTLIACKTNRRAGAVYAVYHGVRNGLTKDQIEQDSASHGINSCRYMYIYMHVILCVS